MTALPPRAMPNALAASSRPFPGRRPHQSHCKLSHNTTVAFVDSALWILVNFAISICIV